MTGPAKIAAAAWRNINQVEGQCNKNSYYCMFLTVRFVAANIEGIKLWFIGAEPGVAAFTNFFACADRANLKTLYFNQNRRGMTRYCSGIAQRSVQNLIFPVPVNFSSQIAKKDLSN